MPIPGYHPLDVGDAARRQMARLATLERRIAALEREPLPEAGGGGGGPTGPAGGVLTGTYPNPQFSSDMVYQTELNTELGLKVSRSLFTAKGDILVGSDAGNPLKLGVAGASDGWVLMLDQAQPLGMKWAEPPAGGGGGPVTITGSSKAFTMAVS